MSKMPVLFIGHGSPMNAIEDNEFTDNWYRLGKELPKPEAILSVSAHWYTEGTRICDAGYPRQIYDMYGFPKELYHLKLQEEIPSRYIGACYLKSVPLSSAAMTFIEGLQLPIK